MFDSCLIFLFYINMQFIGPTIVESRDITRRPDVEGGSRQEEEEEEEEEEEPQLPAWMAVVL
jgi:Ca2+:H+ antiporter